MFGAGGEFANRVYLNTWYIIGPFPGRHGGDLFDNPSYPPEKAVLLDAVYYGKDQRLLQWRYVTAQQLSARSTRPVEDSVYYGYTEVFVDQACDLIAWIGADDDVQIYLNDQHGVGGRQRQQAAVLRCRVQHPQYLSARLQPHRGQARPAFQQGRNKIFFKLSNGPNDPYLVDGVDALDLANEQR